VKGVRFERLGTGRYYNVILHIGSTYVPVSDDTIAELKTQTLLSPDRFLDLLIQNGFAHGLSLRGRKLSIVIHERMSDHRRLVIDRKRQHDQPRYIKSQCEESDVASRGREDRRIERTESHSLQ